MVRLFTFYCCLLISFGSRAQSTTYIGAEVAYSADFFKISDPGGRVTYPDISSALWGATLRYTLSQHLFLESGIYARAYKVGLAFDHSYGSSGTDRTGYLVPLRVGGRFPLFRGALAICPVAGFTFGFTDEGLGGLLDSASQQDGTTSIRYMYTVSYPSQVFSLVQAGVGIDIRLWPKTLLSLSTNFYGGINKILIQRIGYIPGNGAAVKATQHTNGGFYTVGIGLRREVNWFK